MNIGTCRLPNALLPVPVAGLWLLVKVGLFRGLEYTSDIFAIVQLSRGWLLGRPLLQENRFGESLIGHSYFLAVPLGLLTLPLGAYGLFVAHAALLCLAFVELFRAPGDDSPARRLATALVFVFGPVGFWLWDEPLYGWHFELLYVPLSILFASTFRRDSRLAWLWAALLVLLREDGAIQCGCVHLLLLWSDDRTATPTGRRLRGSVPIVASWGAVFLVGLFLKHWLQPSTTARLTAALLALGDVVGRPALLHTLLMGIAGALLLLASGAILAPPGIRARTAVAAVPLMATNVVSSAAYAFSEKALEVHGPAWQVRFAMLWGLVGASLVAGRASSSPPTERKRWWVLLALSVVLQLLLLCVLRGYSPAVRVAAGIGGTGLVADVLAAEERAFLECIPTVLPPRTSIASQTSFFAYFHRHDVVWPDFVANAWRPPAVVVCETAGRLPAEASCARLLGERERAGFEPLVVGGVATAFEPDLAEAMVSCSGPTIPPESEVGSTGAS